MARILLIASVLGAALCTAFAEVRRVEVVHREEVMAGAAFGSAGAYERLVGRVHFRVRVGNPRNARIVDLAKAENLEGGRVDFSADVVILRPADTHESLVSPRHPLRYLSSHGTGPSTP